MGTAGKGKGRLNQRRGKLWLSSFVFLAKAREAAAMIDVGFFFFKRF